MVRGVGINVIYVEKDPYTIRVFFMETDPCIIWVLCTTTYGSFFFYVRSSLYYMGLFFLCTKPPIYMGPLMYDSTHST